jgi:hypothetical protein
MAEIQKQPQANSAELAQRFVQFVMMHTQNILYVLGRLPEAAGAPPNLQAAKMLIDQLEMIKDKTEGNLGAQEIRILESALTNVRLAFVEVSGGTPASMMPSPVMGGMPDLGPEEDDIMSAPGEPDKAPAPAPAAEAKPAEPVENKKKFSKSYG